MFHRNAQGTVRFAPWGCVWGGGEVRSAEDSVCVRPGGAMAEWSHEVCYYTSNSELSICSLSGSLFSWNSLMGLVNI